jgi:DNA-binding NarL/FixJ family response regulator
MIRILIADDHALIRRGLKDILLEEFTNALIKEVNDAESLLIEARNNEWDIVITDLTMPGRSGLEALQEIKQLSPKLPVLVLSVHSEDHYAIRALKAGAAGYLMKESAPDELAVAVNKALQGKKYITPSLAEKLADSYDINTNKTPHEVLSDREFEVFKMIASGKSVSEIGEVLFLSPTTISTYRSRILTKMNIKNNAGLTQYAMQNKII